MVKNKGKVRLQLADPINGRHMPLPRLGDLPCLCASHLTRESLLLMASQGGKNRRRGKADGDMKRELTFKEDGQGEHAS